MKKNILIALLKNKWVLTFLLFASLCGIFYSTMFYTMKNWESTHLFLNTPDYFTLVKQTTFPLWTMVQNYCLQFFYYPHIGAGILALPLTILFIISTFCIGKNQKYWYGIILIILGVTIILVTHFRETEKRNQLEYAAEKHMWNDVLNIATPEETNNDRTKLPYAILALAAQNELGNKLFYYPIESIKDFDTQGKTDYHYYIFKMIFYDAVDCPNEAIHATFQSASNLPFGTSFGTLRRLVRFNKQLENQLMINKYEEILCRSTLHSYIFTQETTPLDTIEKNTSWNEKLISHDIGYNLSLILDRGQVSPQLVNYFLCYLLTLRSIDSFIITLQHLGYTASLPVHFQEALLVYKTKHPDFDISKFEISANVIADFQQYQTSHIAIEGKDWTYHNKGPIQQYSPQWEGINHGEEKPQ